jgi:predicted unusual protein kinase regulating ubiquinone biosynthesis (AarF/ABC1/UbiB family)
MKQGMKDLFLGFVVNNPHNMVAALASLGFIGEGANLVAIERGVSLMMEQYHGMSLGEARDLNVRDVAHELEDLFYRQPFRIPAQFAFVGRAVGTLSGLATGLAPEFNLVSIAVPYAQAFLGLDRQGANQTAREVFQQVLDAGRIALALPATMERVLSKLEAGQLEIRVAEDGVGPSAPARGRRAPYRSANLVPMLVCMTAFISGVVLTLNQVVLAGWFCLGVGALAAISLLLRR